MSEWADEHNSARSGGMGDHETDLFTRGRERKEERGVKRGGLARARKASSMIVIIAVGRGSSQE